jgi:hypothetical protein
MLNVINYEILHYIFSPSFYYFLFFLCVAQHPKSGLGRFILEVTRSHTIRHTHTRPVRLLWTSDQLVAEAATNTTHNKHKRRTSMPWAGFEPAIPAIQQPQTYAFDRTATEIDFLTFNYSPTPHACPSLNMTKGLHTHTQNVLKEYNTVKGLVSSSTTISNFFFFLLF